MQLPSLLFVAFALVSHGVIGALHDTIHQRHRAHHKCKNKSGTLGTNSNHDVGNGVYHSCSSFAYSLPVTSSKPTMLGSYSTTSTPLVSPSLVLQTSPPNGGRINSTTSPVESSTSSSVSTTSSTPASTPTNRCKLTPISSADKEAYLESHNDFRRNHSVSPLIWNDTLSDYARNWTCGCRWEHSQGPYGENLAAGTVFPPLDVVIFWGSEEKDYNPNNPQYSHYTQLVWRSSKSLGCHIAQCQGGPNQIYTVPWQFHACEYDPPGKHRRGVF